MKQKGFAPVLILIALAALVGVAAIAYGYFVVNKSSTSETNIPKMENPLNQQTPVVGTPGCPELDYTGCDTSQDFMTWSDDGVR
jgi:hypothetical protein